MAHCLGPSQDVAKLAVLDCSSDEEAARRALAFSDYAAVELWCGSRWVCQVNPVKRSDEVSSHIARANAFLKDNRAEDAMADYKAAVQLDPLNAEAHCGIGKALHVLCRYTEAIPSYDRAIELKPDFVDAHLSRGVALAALGRLQEAVHSYYQVLSTDPNNADVYKFTGDLLATRGQFEAAVSYYDNAIVLRPGYARAYHNRAFALRSLQRLDEALHSIDRALEYDPALYGALGERIWTKMNMCLWEGLDSDCAQAFDLIAEGHAAGEPFTVLATGAPPEIQRRCAELLVRSYYPPHLETSLPPRTARRPQSQERIRIAYVSGDLCNHAVSLLAAGVFEEHDRDRFEVHAISYGPRDGSDLRVRLENGFEHFIDVRDKDDHAIAALIRDLDIEIAIDLNGHTTLGRPGILARRAAPIQVNYLGYPGTMGAPFMDYLIADRQVIPENHRPSYTESVVYLPDSYLCNDRKRAIADTVLTRGELGLPETGFVFCSFSNSYKIRRDIFDVWMRLLRQVHVSVLWLSEWNETAARNLRREADHRRIAPERLVFAPRMPSYSGHLARHRQADLFLDTLPYNAHTTASDALWAGLPVLTCPGDSFPGRVGASLLTAVGLPQLIAPSLDDYEIKALELARDPASLSEIRTRLAAVRDTCPLFDTRRFARSIEAAYLEMARRHRSGLAPESFSV